MKTLLDISYHWNHFSLYWEQYLVTWMIKKQMYMLRELLVIGQKMTTANLAQTTAANCKSKDSETEKCVCNVNYNSRVATKDMLYPAK